MAKLGKDQIVSIAVLNKHGQSHCATARLLGVTEGTVRYHLRRKASSAQDGRKKTFLIEELGLAEAIEQWWASQLGGDKDRPPSVELLLRYLQEEHDYRRSYKALLRCVRAKYPAPKRRPFRRVETPPGAQVQSDWLEQSIDIGDANGPTALYGFIMRLSHSRKKAVVWSRSKDQLAWLRCHNEAFTRLGGVAAVNRIDNEKTAIGVGAGPWGEINECYRAYARSLKFHPDACEPRCPEQKGKVERGVAEVKSLALDGRCFTSMQHLQEYTDAKLEAESQRRICPATGKTVAESWQNERPLLTPLPATLPEPFDLIKPVRSTKTVQSVLKGARTSCRSRKWGVPWKYGVALKTLRCAMRKREPCW